MYLIAPSSEHNNLTILFAVADEISKKWIKFGVGGTSKEISNAVKALSSAGIILSWIIILLTIHLPLCCSEMAV